MAKGKKAGAAKVEQANVTLYLYAAILADALSGSFGDIIRRFYVSAVSYHMKQKTAFPRGRIMHVELLAPDKAREFIERHAVTSIPAGSLPAQRIFDQMMVETQAQQTAKKS